MITNILGLKVMFPNKVIGHYFEKGVYKDMTFIELLSNAMNKTPIPKTFVKYNFNWFYVADNTIFPG